MEPELAHGQQHHADESAAFAIADGTEPVELRELLYYLVDTVLDRPSAQADPEPALLQLLPAMSR